MATIKSYTDIEQSRKLAEILQIESADMYYGYGKDKPEFLPVSDGDVKCLSFPCWSLAALLEEIPEEIDFDDDESNYALEILKEGDLYYLSYSNPLEGDKLNIEPQENFVDACYDMILKLHKLKLL